MGNVISRKNYGIGRTGSGGVTHLDEGLIGSIYSIYSGHSVPYKEIVFIISVIKNTALF